MADTVDSLATRVHDLLVAILTEGPSAGAAAGLQDVVARGAALGPDGAWLAAAGHTTLGMLALAHGRTDQTLLHLDAAVTAGFNDCVMLHADPLRPLHGTPRFRALYQRMLITQADLDEVFWLHQEMQVMSRDAQQASVDNLGRLDTGVSSLPQVPMPTRRPHTSGVWVTRLDFASTQSALQRTALKAEFQRSSGNTALSLIDDSWDYARARRDAWGADELDSRRLRAAEARAFVERPGAGAVPLPCPPLGSIVYPV
ncbi:hypothetical protein ACFQ8C_04640 [Streptomyces sp. NPDC056503]|uniref:hypothetical protein n=1 Tax=Streptomyces sp. NPDC056503 TaxID=3345842 RepID=UPI00367CFEF0